MPVIYESAALDIGQHGWWKSGWPVGPAESGPKCIWYAVNVALDRFGRDNPELDTDARRYAEWELLSHFGLTSLIDVMDLNDRQPDHEGQGWAIYHLNTLAQQLRVRHKIANGCSDVSGDGS